MFNKENFLTDYSVFKKTLEEKVKASIIKKEWKRTMKMFYGRDWKRHNNFPESLPE